MTQTLPPPHQRLHGFAMRHLAAMLSQCQKAKGQSGFDVFRNDQTKTKDLLIAYLLANYSPAELDKASEDARAQYPSFPPRRKRSNADIPVGDSLPSPQELANLSAPSNPPQQSQGSQQGEQQSPASQPPALPPYLANPPAGGNSQDPMALMAESLWPYLRPKAGADALDVAGKLDQHTHAAIVKALQKVSSGAASGGAMVAAGSTSVPIVVPTIVHLSTPAMPTLANLGIQHKHFPKLLKMCNARLRSGHRLNVWLHGPAGTGKTTAAEKVAEALGLPFQYNGALSTGFQVMGYMDAHGKYVTTAFRKAWEHGGVYLFDEIDASMPDALLTLNGALANSLCSFPDGVVKRHPDCVVIAGANTTGSGGTVEYVGRYKQDAALVDRFVFLDWPLDEALEDALCANKTWANKVRKSRAKAKSAGVKGHQITPRATLYGEALLAAGLDMSDVESSVLRKGLPNDQWSTIAPVAGV